MFHVNNSLDFVICPFVRRNQICGRPHCVFNHKNAKASIRATDDCDPHLLRKITVAKSKKNDLEYDPVDNFAVSGLTPRKDTVFQVGDFPSIFETHTEKSFEASTEETQTCPAVNNSAKLSCATDVPTILEDKTVTGTIKDKERPSDKKKPVKRKILADVDVDFLSIEEGGGGGSPKKKLKKDSTKAKVLKTKQKATEILSSSKESFQESTISCASVTIPFPAPEKATQNASNPYDLVKKRLQLLGQLKATLVSSPGSRFTVPEHLQESVVPSAETITKSSTVCKDPKKTNVESPVAIMGKIRVAHQPKGQSAENRQPLLSSIKEEVKPPLIDPGSNSIKIPIIVRQQYLNKFFEQYHRLTSATDAHRKSAEAEKSIYDRITSKSVYLSSCVNAIKRLTSMTPKDYSDIDNDTWEEKPTNPNYISHNQVLFGSKYSLVTQNAKKSTFAQVVNTVTGEQFYKLCERYCLNLEELKDHGFPGFGETKRKSSVLRTEEMSAEDIEERVCSRCGKSYSVYARSGSPVTCGDVTTECVYHWGKLWNNRETRDQRFNCCQGDVSSVGCCISKGHVIDRYVEPDSEFVFASDSFQNRAVYALDCEMCYTSMGVELTRISIVNDKNESCYDKLVKPRYPVVDHNTRFSGITEAMLKNVTTNLKSVHKDLLKLISSSTILVGHSLESDLRALQFKHSRIIDTSVLFPHRRGLPYKRSLKNLALDHLGKIIQESSDGHDSTEDAQTCISLLRYKMKMDMVLPNCRSHY